MRIGFCGLGLMGREMVLRLLSAGHQLTVWNRSAEKTAQAIAAGACGAATPADAAARSDIVILCLFDSAAVEHVVFGPMGISSASTARYLVDHSSIAPAATRAFASRMTVLRGPEWVDAPVSGGVAGARAGSLTVMAGGSTEAIAIVRDVIGSYAARLVRVGPVGAGQTAKLCNQTIVAATLLAIAEAVVLAHRSGIDPRQLPDALAGGWADSTLLRTFVPRMTAPPAERIGALSTLLKDVESIDTAARDSGLSLPVSAAVRDTLRQAVSCGLGAADLARIVELWSGQKSSDLR